MLRNSSGGYITSRLSRSNLHLSMPDPTLSKNAQHVQGILNRIVRRSCVVVWCLTYICTNQFTERSLLPSSWARLPSMCLNEWLKPCWVCRPLYVKFGNIYSYLHSPPIILPNQSCCRLKLDRIRLLLLENRSAGIIRLSLITKLKNTTDRWYKHT